MIVLPELKKYSKLRPHRPSFEPRYLVPNFKEHRSFWDNIHAFLYSLGAYSPVGGHVADYINPGYGYFGDSVHPVTENPQYYHLGVHLEFQKKHEVKPIMRGVLEYSGYGATNGYYVLLSHPHIQTEDGYILHTTYCHLKKPAVKFSSYQKMLREISLGSYPVIEIGTDTMLGFTGQSGIAAGDSSSVFIQCDFRKHDHDTIVVDPMHFFSENIQVNNSRLKQVSI